jgi:tetratricopeptide (TPR) repeat protein
LSNYEFSDFDDEHRSIVSTLSLSETRDRFASDFKLLVRDKKIEEISAWSSICWEINNCRLIQDWDRALELFDQAEKLKLKQPSEINLLRGQFDFLVGFNQTELMTILSPCRKWPDEMGVCVGLGACKSEDSDGGTSSAKLIDRAKVLDSSHHLKKALSGNPELNSVYSILARCQFALGEFQEAAKNYERVLAHQSGLEPNEKAIVLRSAALCYENAGEIQNAIESYKRLLNERQDERGIFLRIAELHVKQIPPNVKAACEALRKEFEENPPSDNDWTLSTILMLAESVDSSDTHEVQLREFFRANPAHTQFVDSFLKQYWPVFDSMSKPAQLKWVYGVSLMHFPSFSNLREAVGYFATAVEIELRSRVFAKFREQLQNAEPLKEQWPKKKELSALQHFLKGSDRLTLGEMVTVLDLCKRPQEEILKRFGGMIQGAGINLNKIGLLLPKINRVRKPAIHSDQPDQPISETEWMEAPKLCRDILETLTKIT